MARIDHLSLVLPDVLARLQRLHAQEAPLPELPSFEALLRAAVLTRQWSNDDPGFARLDPWQTALLRALGPESYREGLASAALSWRGEGGEWSRGTWLQLEPVHLAAGLDSLQMSSVAALGEEEAAQLLTAIQPLLALEGFELRRGAQGGWYAWHQASLDLVTYSPRSRFVDRVYDIMPGGADGPRLRRLMTELQMLLHAHPLNGQRERRGQAAINALWFWGAGHLDSVTTTFTQRLLGNNAYLRGLCEHLHLHREAPPAEAQQVFSSSWPRLILVLNCGEDDASLQRLDADWLRAFEQAVRRGHIKQLEVHVDHWRIALSGGRWNAIRPVFKRSRPALTELLA